MKKTIFLLSSITILATLINCTSPTTKKGEKDKDSTAVSNRLTPIEKGSGIASRTKEVLGMNLLTAISQRGAGGAVDFCSTRALHLTDSMGKVLGAGIRRVSEKNRNPVNQADSTELDYIRQVQKAISKGESFKPALSETATGYRAYYPILTDKLCLQCHGDLKTEIKPATYTRIRELYPADKAIGFRLNELRGIWVVDMKK